MTDIELLWLKTISEDPKMIAYRPRLRAIAGSITATILLQQIIYRWVHNDFKPFYKYKEPCTADDYREGDSWCEELAFSRDEFDTALRHIAQKVSRNVEKDPGKLVYYWTMPNRKTWYEINYTALCNVAIPIYVGGKSPATQPDKSTLPILYTKKTSKKTTKKGENPESRSGESTPPTTPPPAPALAVAPTIALAEKVAEATSYDPPEPSKPTVSVKPARQQAPLPESPHFDGRKFVKGFIPAGKGATAVEVYYEAFSIRDNDARLTEPNEEDLINLCPDLDRLRTAVTAYRRSGNYRKGNLQLILDWYNGGVPSHKPTTYANGAAKPATATALADMKLKDWLLKFYNVNHLPTVIDLTGKTEKELRDEFKQWRIANGLPPG